MSDPTPALDDRSSSTGDDTAHAGETAGAGRTPPGPDGLPLVGNTLGFVRDPFDYYDGLSEYGDVVRHHVFGTTWTVLFHPDHVARVLVGESHRFRRYNFEDLGPAVAPEGLLFTHDEQWRRQRTLLQPAFTPATVAEFADSMVESAAQSADAWSDGDTIAADRQFSALTLEVLAATLFDVELEGRREAITGAARALNDVADPGRPSAFLPDWVPTPTRRSYERAMARFDAAVMDLVEERRASTETEGDRARTDMLTTLLEATTEDGQELSDTEIRDQLVTFLFAGHETSSLALTYAFALLATAPDARERLETELDEVCGDADPTVADLSDLEYTGWVVDEALRLYPPAYALFREAHEDVRVGDYLIPEGTKVTLPAFAIHTDGRWWDDPDSFRPERWGVETDRPEYAYFPFGGGPRHCIAMRFARMELRLVLATLARRVRFDLESDSLPSVRMAATLSPVDPVRLTVRSRA
ncbi:cytochrome P450 [Natronobiforma cellulositropha]|uniref:cytochrome P450 n=1 Tax=Natronobiforma cellulositropha TaxID=1679076 RepID=UPI0021D5997F|nr:cytochrome P450 [Natronobiforma cellulositropha]